MKAAHIFSAYTLGGLSHCPPWITFNTHQVVTHFYSMSVERDIRFDLIARLCPNTTGAELRSVATEAGMFAIRARRKVATERDFLDAVEKVVRQGTKFSSTYVDCCFFDPLVTDVTSAHRPLYQVYN
jgi:hypothetical protein